MSIWVTSAIVIGIALGITAAITGWAKIWVDLNVDRGWPFWLCGIIALAPVIIGLYFYAAFMIAQ